MRKPNTIEYLYLDFDGFFASVEQHADPKLRGKPIGVVPFAGTERTCIIAVSREAKVRGVKNVMSIKEARQVCPDMILVPQKPDLYRRAHNALIAEIDQVLPVTTIKSIDELACRLDPHDIQTPDDVVSKIKSRIKKHIGLQITASVGLAANRQLAKMACKAGKWRGNEYGNGLAIWNPEDMPTPLIKLSLSDIPGIGSRMKKRLSQSYIYTVEELYNIQPKHMRRLWNGVTGERLWYALHGYDIEGIPSGITSMIGHGRVLPPESRTLAGAKDIARLLTIKAARRLRRAELYSSGFLLWFSLKGSYWQNFIKMYSVNDDHAILSTLEKNWTYAQSGIHEKVFQVGIALVDLTPASTRQTDLFLNDDKDRQKWESITQAMDGLNRRYGKTIVSQGAWKPPAGDHVGGKISFTRVPEQEDFW